jgi:UDP:flavonoid glycosyltransferase YjiC (YdhE family)
LTEDKLVAAIQATSGTQMRRRAAALSQRIREEDGVARAVEIVEKYLGRGTLASAQHQ